MSVAVAHTLAFTALFLVAVARPAAAADSKAILLLQSYGYDTPGRIPFDAAFARALRGAADLKIELYIETIDPNRFRSEEQVQRVRTYLRERYADKQIAVVAAAYDRALGFLRDERDPLFPGAPTVALLTARPQALPDHVSVIWSGGAVGESAALVLTLHPQARQIALIDAALRSPASDAVYTEALTQVERAAPNTPVIALWNLPLDELLARVSMLPADTPILVVRQLLGRRGEPVATADAIGEIARAARSPVYVTTDLQIGSGATGGIVVSVEQEAVQLATLALRIARDGSLRVPPARSALVPTFDWRQLQRWGISEARLPSGSAILFRQPSAWALYRRYIVGGALLVLLQTVFIVALLVQRTRRRAAETEKEELMGQLQGLAGRLIAARESERARIARDLHDDVSQQLAGLAIGLSGLKRRVGARPDEGRLAGDVSSLQERTVVIAEHIRHLSHDLHPSVLQHAGLVAALSAHCAELRSQETIALAFSAEGDFETMDPEAALCLYRVAQEALRNVFTHAEARHADVRLLRLGSSAQMTIADDGKGFDPVRARDPGRGLGLVSINERVRSAGGTVSIATERQKGTRVWVQVPIARQHTAAASDESARSA